MIQDIKDKKVKEREEKQKKLQELNPIKFEKQAIDYEKIINEQNILESKVAIAAPLTDIFKIKIKKYLNTSLIF